ncbi:hypothetical protein ACFWNN_01225 [Lentzea sp. NPDC058450]|uniref:hypothetical protein n=1 Tax=Lentzea sp. NPDC058450 TaxID=3346505 RepID=UPI003661C025
MRATIHAWIAGPPIPDPTWDSARLGLEFGRTVLLPRLRTLRLDWVTADPLPHVDSPYPCFRASAASSRELPTEAVARLLADEDSEVRTQMARTAPHLVDAETAERVERTFQPATCTRWRRRTCWASPPKRRAVAQQPALPQDALAALLDEDWDTVGQAARSPRLPVEQVERLLVAAGL